MGKSEFAEVFYYFTLLLGYGWCVILLFAEQPFDAFVLFFVTHSFRTYRNRVKELLA